MHIKPIRTREDYARSIGEVEADWETEFPEGSAAGERYAVLLTLVEAYEAANFPLADPDPVEAIKIRMEDKGLENKDLLPIFGTRARVHEVLNKVRGLSIDHIRELNKRLGIPAEILLKKYRLKAQGPSNVRGVKRRALKKHPKKAA